MVFKHWNRLPRQAVKPPYLELFKSQLSWAAYFSWPCFGQETVTRPSPEVLSAASPSVMLSFCLGTARLKEGEDVGHTEEDIGQGQLLASECCHAPALRQHRQLELGVPG